MATLGCGSSRSTRHGRSLITASRRHHRAHGLDILQQLEFKNGILPVTLSDARLKTFSFAPRK
jgi:hypothetical protein